MATLLRIDSSPMNGWSVSRALTGEFVEHWKRQHPHAGVITRDLTATELRPVTVEWITGAHTPESAHTPEQRKALALSDLLISELQQADHYVIGVPMHNFGVPATLKLWIDQIARAGKTFAYINGRPEGLLKSKRATFLIASGGVYDSGTAMASFNFVEPYLRTFFAFLGVTDTNFINAGGTAQIQAGQVDRGQFLQPHIRAIESHLQPAA
jgi:FMN-dependent NADH-azoreductase